MKVSLTYNIKLLSLNLKLLSLNLKLLIMSEKLLTQLEVTHVTIIFTDADGHNFLNMIFRIELTAHVLYFSG